MSILDFLDYFDRLRAASAGAVYGGLLDDNDTALSAAWKGFTGKDKVSWGDVVGIPEGQPDDDWASWLAKNGARLGLDMALDPLNLLAGTGAITKGLGLSQNGVSALGRLAKTPQASWLATKWASSPGFQLFGHEVPANVSTGGLTGERLEEIVQQNLRLGKTSDVDDMGRAAFDATTQLYKQGAEPLDLFSAIERRNVPESMTGAVEAIEPLRQSALTSLENLTDLRDRLGITGPWATVMDEADIAYLPHMQTIASQRRAQGHRLGSIRYEPNVASEGRDIRNWVDENGLGITIGKADDPRTGITAMPDPAGGKQYWYGGEIKKDTGLYEGGERVFDRPAMLEQKVAEYPGVDFVTDPAAAAYETARKRREMESYLRTLADLKDEGYVRTLGAGTEGYQSRTGSIGDWRQLQLPGFEHLEAPKWAATRLENLGTGHIGGQPLSRNIIEDFGQRVADSSLGRLLGDSTQWWKNNVLPYPGWVAGNLGTNVALLQQAGVNPLRALEAAKAQAGVGGDIMGLPYAQFLKEMTDRDVLRGGLSRTEAGSPFRTAIEGEGRVRSAVNDLSSAAARSGMPTTASVVDTVGRGVAATGEMIGRYNKGFMTKVGGPVEDNARLAAAMDYVRKNSPDFATLDPHSQAIILDKAAQHAKDALIDYSMMTPFERNLSAAIPFYGWTRGTIGRTADLATSNPAALGNTSRILDAAFDPLSDHDRSIADPWIREQGPVDAGWLGDMLSSDGGKQIFLTGRFLPQGNIEQMISRPMDYALSNVSPVLKAPAELTDNRNRFKNRDIDRVSGGLPGSLLNPLTGGPYELAGGTRFGYEPPAGLDYLIQNSPAGRGLSLASDLGRQAGLWDDPYKREGNVWAGLAYAGTGGKVMPFDTDKYESKRANEFRKRVTDLNYLLKLATQKGDQKAIEHYANELNRAMSQRPSFLEAG